MHIFVKHMCTFAYVLFYQMTINYRERKKTESDNDQVSVDHEEPDCYIIVENHPSQSFDMRN